MKLKILCASSKSLMQIIHSSGPWIEPWGATVVIGQMFDFILLFLHIAFGALILLYQYIVI